MTLLPQLSVEQLAILVYELECRLTSYERIAIQMIGEGMSKTYEREIEENPLHKANLAGREAARRGESATVPPQYIGLHAIAWKRGFEEGKREPRHAAVLR